MTQIDIVMVVVALLTVIVCLFLAWAASPTKERRLIAAAVQLLGVVVAIKVSQLATASIESSWLRWIVSALVVLAIGFPFVWISSKITRWKNDVAVPPKD